MQSQLFDHLRSREGVLATTHTTAAGDMGSFNPWSAEIWLTRIPSDGFVTDAVLDWYGRFAKGRPGVLVVEATAMIVNGFIEPITRELPMEYAVELNRLIELQMEGAIG